MSSEQDKRVVYMGNFERFKKETYVRNEDVLSQLALTKKVLRYAVILSTIAFVLAVVGIAI
jgi:hypothetical protein